MLRLHANGRRATRGVTLVEAAVGISLLGIVLAVFLPTFVRNLRSSKLDEPSELLQQLADGVQAYYPDQECLPPRAAAPEAPSDELVEVDFQHEETPGAETWAALGFAPARPIRYRYEFIPHVEGCGVRVAPGEVLVTLRATGDLDDDGIESTWVRELTLEEGTGRLVDIGVLRVDDRVE